MANRKVTYAKMHAGLFIPGPGTLGDTLPPGKKTLKNLRMTLEDSGNLLVESDESAPCVVPSANIIIMMLEPAKK